MIRFIIGLALLLGLMWLVSRLSKAPPGKRARLLKLLLLYGGVALLLFLILTGKLHPLFAAVMALVPWVQRAIMLGSLFRMFQSKTGGAQASPGQRSTVRSAFLEMTLDHDSGRMNGVITAGQHKGSRLDQLDFETMLALWRQYQGADPQSAQLLQAYLQHEHAQRWRRAGGADGSGGDGGGRTPPAEMSVEQAYQVLGLEPDSGRDAVVAAHKQLMQRFHPDRGGSAYLAGLINQAREQLLKHLEA